jgi:hypothetical protein
MFMIEISGGDFPCWRSLFPKIRILNYSSNGCVVQEPLQYMRVRRPNHSATTLQFERAMSLRNGSLLPTTQCACVDFATQRNQKYNK